MADTSSPIAQALIDALMRTWPARMGQGILSAAKLPGDVYQGNAAVPSSDNGGENIGRVTDLAGLLMSGATGAPSGALGSGPVMPMKLYRGESAYNKNGNFFTGDQEWARQFTQSGRPEEVIARDFPAHKIYDPPQPVYAGDPDAVDAAIQTAKSLGHGAVKLSEAAGEAPGISEPASYFVFNKALLK